jgi:restriction endonuclease S subunit
VICDFNFDNYFGQKERIQEPSLQELSDAVVSISRKLAPSFEKLEQEIMFKERKPVDYQKLTDDSWTRLPLVALFKVSSGSRNVQPTNPLISVDLLRDISSNSTEKAMVKTSNGITESDAIMIITGANSGEVFRPISGTLSSTLASFLAKENYLDKKFAYYLLKAHQDVFQMLSSGVGQKYIRINDLKSYSLRIPSVQEQHRMAEYLDSIVLIIDDISNALGVKVPAMEDYRNKLISDVVKGIVRV